MSEEWMADRVRAGDRIVDRILKAGGNPVHPGVELGRAAGKLAARYHELHGESAAQNFLQTFVEVFNLETAKVNEKREVLRLRASNPS
jgi:hypothetical protein